MGVTFWLEVWWTSGAHAFWAPSYGSTDGATVLAMYNAARKRERVRIKVLCSELGA